MALEDLTGASKYINALVATNPVGATDSRRQGDDHIRGVKNVLLNTFANITGAVTATQDELNVLDGYTGNTADLEQFSGTDSSGLSPFIIPGFVSGLIPSQAADANHDITFSAGLAADSGNSSWLELTSAITKRIDATWAVGDTNGGLFSGTVAADTWYHLFVIRRSDTGVVDAGFDTSVTAANIPTDYDEYRRVGSVLTDSSSNIFDFRCYEKAGGAREFEWDSRDTIEDYISVNPGSSRVLVSLDFTPPDVDGMQLHVFFGASDSTAVSHAGWIAHPDYPDADPLSGGADHYNVLVENATDSNSNWFGYVRCNSSAQVAFRITNSNANTIVLIHTWGWVDDCN